MSAPERRTSRAKQCAMIGLSVALMAVCSWVTVPIGPVPLTLQMFAIPFVLCVLRPSEAVAATAAYLVLGAVGVPVFSGMRGGIGVLMGPTGGFLLSYIVGVALAALFLHAVSSRTGAAARSEEPIDPAQRARMSTWQRLRISLAPCGVELVAGFIFIVVAYAGGWLQYMLVTGTTPEVAFLTSVAPFILPDIVKAVVAVLCAQPVKMFSTRR